MGKITLDSHRLQLAREMKINLKERFWIFLKKGKIPPPVGLELTTFELEVQHASPLRHGGFISMKENIFCVHGFFFTCKHHFVPSTHWRVPVPPPEEFFLLKKYSKSFLQVNLHFYIAVFRTITPVLCTWGVKNFHPGRVYLSYLEEIGLHCLLFQ